MWKVIIHHETFRNPAVATKIMRNLIAENVKELMTCIKVPTKEWKEAKNTKVLQVGFILVYLNKKEFHVIGDVFKIKIQDGLHDSNRYIDEDKFKEVSDERNEARLYFFFIRTYLNMFAIPMVHINTLLDSPIPSEKYRDKGYMEQVLIENADKGIERILDIGEVEIPAESEPHPAPWEGD